MVKYGTNPLNLDKTYNNTIGKTTHEVLLNGLTPNTKYYYSLEGVPSFVNLVSQQYFKTSPPVGSEKPTRIWVIGDFGVGLPTQHLVYADYLARNLGKETDLWLWLGDNAYDGGTVSEYERNVFNIYGPTLRNHMLWPTAGNHDLKSCNTLAETGPYFDFFSLPKNGEAGGVPSGKEAYYSFDYANIHFICLESTDNNRMPTGPMVEWLKKDLRANNQKWTIAFWHHPPYSKGSHDSDNEGQLIEMRENVLPLLEKHGVDLVLSGHSHCYERSYLLNGHYGKSDSFDPESHLVQGKTDGKQSGDGAYTKPNAQISNRGTVYSVVGSSGSPTDFTTLDHPAHYFGSNLNGHMILEINGDSLTAKFHPILGGLPTTTDEFSIVKENTLLPCDTVSLLGNDTLICQGNSLSLGVADDYLAYSWSTGENEPKIEVNKAGWYVLAAKVNGTCTLRDSIFVNIPSANLQPSNNALLCKGDSLKLVVDNNLSNITWSTLDSNTASIFVKNAGTYTVKGLSSEGCIVYDTLKLSLELPLAVLFSFPVNPARVNTELTFVDISPNSRSRTWSFGDGFSSSDSIAKHSYTQAGEYLVSLKAKGLVCEGSKSAPLRVENPNGLSEFNTENYTAIRIGEGLFTIQLNELVKLEKIKIYTANGQLVKAKISSLNNQLQIDLSQESPGVYLLKTEKINIRLLR